MINFHQTQKKWYVIVAKTLHYRKAASVLEKLSFSFYLPIQRQLHNWSDRKKWVDVPIFNPYIFLFTNEAERKLLFQSCDFFHFLNREGKPATAREDEIENIKLLCNHPGNLKIEQYPVKKGDQVEVTRGALSGMTGYALQQNGRHRFHVQIMSLGQFASVDIDSSWVRIFG